MQIIFLILMLIFSPHHLRSGAPGLEAPLIRLEPAPSDTLIKMERTPCYGTCPAYELSIKKNGKVTFIGKRFVAHTDSAEGKISADKVQTLVRMIRESNFMDIPSKPECDSWMTDHPSVFLTVEIEDMRNSITHYQGCKGFEYEEDLYKLETAIDSLAGVNKWVKGE